MMAREASNFSYPEIGVTEPHHLISHHGNKPEKIAEHAKVNVYHMQLFAQFVEQLSAILDGDASLLVHTLMFYGSGMGNGNQLAGYLFPLVAVAVDSAMAHRHIPFEEGTPLASLWL